MKTKLFLIILFVFAVVVFAPKVEAQSPEDLLVDPECVAYSAAADFTGVRICNTVCQRKCVESGQNCYFNRSGDCVDIDFDQYFPEVTEVVRPAFNPFDVELCPNADQRPEDDPYCTLVLVRLGFYAAISLVIFVTVILGFWVVWLRSTAADFPDKVEKSVAVARNAVIGVVIVFLFIAIVQVTSLVVGLTSSLFEVSIVPQPRPVGRGERCDQGYVYCIEPQDSCILDPNVGYKRCL